jgi:hypothetical protein
LYKKSLKTKALMLKELEKCPELADANNNVVKTAVLARGDIFLFLPKYHPEMAPIERCWSQIKPRLAELNSREKNSSPAQVKLNMYSTWKEFNDNHLDTIRRYYGRMFRFVQVCFRVQFFFCDRPSCRHTSTERTAWKRTSLSTRHVTRGGNRLPVIEETPLLMIAFLPRLRPRQLRHLPLAHSPLLLLPLALNPPRLLPLALNPPLLIQTLKVFV